TRYASSPEIGVYSAALRAGQIIVLFLTSVSLMFSPFVADLHNRGETERLDKLFKNLTRWTIAATLPVFLLLAVAPDDVLRVFGSGFAGGEAALLILAAGQLINIATGSVGFVLIMVGRTGWDLFVYAGSLVMNLGLAFWLCPKYGMEGAAIANAATFAASKWARLVLVRRFVSIQPYDRDYWRLLPPALAGLAAMFLIHQVVPGGFLVDLLATGVGGTAVYLAAYLVVGLTAAERRGVSGVVARLKAR
ncbi:MAG TPA: oligosaccharide flippase family protein, partial [Actinomycetota bacterium]